jgi:hypothetical protein
MKYYEIDYDAYEIKELFSDDIFEEEGKYFYRDYMGDCLIHIEVFTDAQKAREVLLIHTEHKLKELNKHYARLLWEIEQ